jgi:hypothetical protein
VEEAEGSVVKLGWYYIYAKGGITLRQDANLKSCLLGKKEKKLVLLISLVLVR